MISTRKFAVGLVLSMAFHFALVLGISGFFSVGPVSYRDRLVAPEPAEVELYYPKQPSPRNGSRLTVAKATDSFAPSRTIGSLGKAKSAPSRDLMVADDLDHLRFHPYDHLERNSPARSRRGARTLTVDNDENILSPGERKGRSRSRARAPISDKGRTASEQDEVLSKISKEDHFSETSDYSALATRRGQPADTQPRQRASSKKLVDLFDAARPDDSGQQRGSSRGAKAGRTGSPGGSKGLPIWIDTTDNRYVSYFREIYRKIQPLWRFPKDLDVTFEQGDVLVQFSVSQKGHLTNVRVKKPSGYPRFDHNAIAAIRGAAPFPPIPTGLGSRLEILAPFEFHNPMIR